MGVTQINLKKKSPEGKLPFWILSSHLFFLGGFLCRTPLAVEVAVRSSNLRSFWHRLFEGDQSASVFGCAGFRVMARSDNQEVFVFFHLARTFRAFSCSRRYRAPSGLNHGPESHLVSMGCFRMSFHSTPLPLFCFNFLQFFFSSFRFLLDANGL